MKKKMAAVFLAGILTSSFLLTGCGNSTADNSSASSSSSASSASASGDLLEQIQSKGEIVVAMEGTWAPWTYHDEDDNLVGTPIMRRYIGRRVAGTICFCCLKRR